MSNQVELAAEERTVSGKQVKKLRREGMVPANLYGQNTAATPIQLPGAPLRSLLSRRGITPILQLRVGVRPPVQALIKDVQRDPKTGDVIHVDFYRVAAREKLKTHVPLHFVNEAEAVKQGEVIVQRGLTDLLVESLPADLPSSIQVDLSRLQEVGATIRVSDLEVPKGVTVLADHNEVVAGLHQTARVAAEAVEEMPEAGPPAAEAAPEAGSQEGA